MKWFSLVNDDVVVYLRNQSVMRFAKTMQIYFDSSLCLSLYHPSKLEVENLSETFYIFFNKILVNERPMELEIQVAVNFLIGYLVNKLPRRRVQLFNEEVVKKLTKKFEGHWYPEKPCKGSGYRCLLITDSLDPVLGSAAEASGLSAKDVKANLPEKLCLWIDPQEVSFRIGKCCLSPRLKGFYFAATVLRF